MTGPERLLVRLGVIISVGLVPILGKLAFDVFPKMLDEIGENVGSNVVRHVPHESGTQTASNRPPRLEFELSSPFRQIVEDLPREAYDALARECKRAQIRSKLKQKLHNFVYNKNIIDSSVENIKNTLSAELEKLITYEFAKVGNVKISGTLFTKLVLEVETICGTFKVEAEYKLENSTDSFDIRGDEFKHFDSLSDSTKSRIADQMRID